MISLENAANLAEIFTFLGGITKFLFFLARRFLTQVRQKKHFTYLRNEKIHPYGFLTLHSYEHMFITMRPRKNRCIAQEPRARFFKPQGIPLRLLETVALKDEELEALRLADFLGREQEEAARAMGVSRPTFSRMLSAARHAVAMALTQGHALKISAALSNEKGENDA